MHTAHRVILSLLLVPAVSTAQSAFDGTWRPDYSPTQPGEPVISVLADGMYDCQACEHPYKIKANGRDQPVAGHPYFDSISVATVDQRHIRLIGKKQGKVVADTTISVSADGANRTEVQTVYGEAPVPIEFTSRFKRSSDGPPGSHPISGGWQLTERELSSHSEDTVYKIVDNTLSMSDRMGRSFSAKLDGTDAPYLGDLEVTSVSVRQIDSRTIIESDMNAGHVVKIATWSVSADGKSVHVRFDDTKGHIQEQDGHKVQ
jgi:hypothetical protein